MLPSTRAFVLTFLALISISLTAGGAPIAGDVDQSGGVDAVDVQLVINDALGMPVAFPCDVDHSESTNAVDVQLVINAALGLAIDSDEDGLCDGAESHLGTEPDVFDTDGDGTGDGQEMLDGTDPLVPDSAIPPDPQDVAPDIDPTVATDMHTAVSFLYEGSNRIQLGVAPGTIDEHRIAVLRGKVVTEAGEPLAGVTITAEDHPDLGRTATREDGVYDLAVNGGGALIVNYAIAGRLAVQRKVDVPWKEFVWLPDVVMIPLDTEVTVVDFSEPIEVARGSVQTDADGERQATLLFPQTTKASLVWADGRKKAVDELNVRLTEYTVGEDGPERMPAELPPTSFYTYAVELTADEALKSGAKSVEFSEPVPFYVENFLEFPVGIGAPVGYYDEEAGAWIPYDNGRVIEIVGADGVLAEVDVDGDAVADAGAALSELGITDAERERLAELYSVGQSLWRVRLPHMSKWDVNWSFSPPDDAIGPRGKKKKKKPNKNCKDKKNSVVECQNQTLGESVPITGTNFTLNYQSDRARGHLDSYTTEIPLSEATVPASLLRIELEIGVAGQEHVYSLPPNANQTYTFTWDGMDAYGRALQGAQPVAVNVGFTYKGVYQETDRFGYFGNGTLITGSRTREEVTLWQDWTETIGLFDARGQGLGGWTLNVHHAYNPLVETLYLGDGSWRSAWSVVAIDTVAGGGASCSPTGACGDGGPATDAHLSYPYAVASAADGSIYIADRNKNRIRRVDPDGVITTVAGTGVGGYSGDGGPATAALLDAPEGVAVAPDGSIYIADRNNDCVRRVGPDGIITTVAGTGINGYSGDGGPATEAQLYSPAGVAVGPDGRVYIADTINKRIRRIEPDGIITTMAGTSGPGGYSGDGGPATEAQLYNPSGVAVGPDGSTYIGDTQNNRVRCVRPDGIISTVAGTGAMGDGGDGGPATEAQLFAPEGVAIAPDGGIYIADRGNNRIRRIGPDGIMTLVAGAGTGGFSGDGGAPPRAELYYPRDVAVGPDGSLYIADRNNNRIRAIGTTLSGSSAADALIPSEDGTQVFHFDANGRHLQTVSALSGVMLYEFNYNADGLLAEIVDGDGNTTTITRDAGGNPTSIVAPGSQTTALAVDAGGNVQSITNPAGEAVALTYVSDGLLNTVTDPNGNMSQYTYDAMGLLTLAQDRAGGSKTFSRSDTADGYTVTKTTAMGRVTVYEMQYLPSDEERSYIIHPDGSWREVLSGTDGSSTITSSDGTTATTRHGPDPRFGMVAPVLESLTVETPDGLVYDLTQNRTVTLGDLHDVLSLQAIQDITTINGRTYWYDYDAAARTLTTTTPEGHQTISTLDGLNRVTSVDLAAGVDPITIAYDGHGRVAQLAQGTLSWTYTYDALNRAVSRLDAAGNETAYSYDGADRIVGVDLPGGETEGYVYDDNGNPTAVIMPSNDMHALAYTLLDVRSSYTPPGNPTYTRSFDLDRALATHTLPSGKVVTNIFEASGLWTEATYPEATVEFTYGASCCERLSGLTWTPTGGGPAQGVSFTYDGVLTTGQTWTGVAVGDFLYDYDSNFLLSNLTLNSGADNVVTPFSYDGDGMLTGYGPFTLERNGPGGALSRVQDDDLTLDLGYDTLARVENRTQTVNGVSVYGCVLSYNNVGRIVRKVESVGAASHTYAYTYDADGRLKKVQRDGALAERYTYDVNGNRLTTLFGSAGYDSQDRLTTYDGETYTFDADGYLAQRGSDTFEYSARGELITATLGGATTISYSYDGLGRMVARTDASGTTQYLYGFPWNPFLVTAVRDDAGVLSTLYYDEEGLLFAMNRGGTIYYVGTDQVGTPHAVANAAGTIVKQIQYDSFGRRLSDSNPGFELPIGFAGGLEDTATGLVRFGYRDYDPTTGRWTARDPVLYEGGQANLYIYVGNDPVSVRDPLGLGCLGGSYYEVVGGGVEICCRDGDCSLCFEVGIGGGSSISVGAGGAKDTGGTIVGEVGFGCGPAGGATAKCSYDEKCGLKCGSELGAGPVKVDPSDILGSIKVSDHPYGTHGPVKCGSQAKFAVQRCRKF